MEQSGSRFGDVVIEAAQPSLTGALDAELRKPRGAHIGSRAWFAERRYRRATRHELARLIQKYVIVETKVSPLRRFVEIVITTFFSLLILYLFLVFVDDVALWLTGRNIFWFVYRPEPFVGRIGLLTIPTLFLLLYLAASIWLRLKRRWARHVNYERDFPQYTTVFDLAEYFQLPYEEVERRQHAGKLVITENFENDRMKELRARAKKVALQSTWGDE